jgi:hypothetical protein
MTQTMIPHPPRKSGRLLPFALAIIVSASGAHGQLAHSGPAQAIALAATLPPYDVVTVKQNKSDNGSFNMSIHDDRFTATNVPLKKLVEFAYDTKDDRIFGISGPVSSINFDVEAKVLGPAHP